MSNPTSAQRAAVGADHPTVAAYLRLLHGGLVRSDGTYTVGVMPVSQFHPARSTWCASIGESVEAICSASNAVYVHCALHDGEIAFAAARERAKRNGTHSPESLEHVRGCAESAVALVGVWSDEDHAKGHHKRENLPPDLDAVLDYLGAMDERLRPSLVVDSGGGAYPWLLFREPWILDTKEQRARAAALVERYQHYIASLSPTYAHDATHDLARVLRAPGTANKYGGLVRVLDLDTGEPIDVPTDVRRATVEEIEQALAEFGIGAEKRTRRDARRGGRAEEPKRESEIEIRDEPSERVRELLARVPRVADLLAGRGKTKGDTSESGYDISLLCALARRGARDPSELATALAHRVRATRRKVRPAYVLRTVRKALARVPERPTIVLVPGELHEAVDTTESVLVAQREPLVYQRAGALVRPVRIERAEPNRGVELANGSLVIREVSESYLLDLATRHVRFVRPSKEGEEKCADPPPMLARALLSRAGHWSFAPLAAVVESPQLLPDGRVIATSGYDRESGILLDTRGVEFAVVPERPTREDALAALALLDAMLEGFPFVAEHDRSAALALLLTGTCRPAIDGPVPLSLVTSPAPSSGKSTLASLPALLATGRPPATISLEGREEEVDKRILALLSEGVRHVSADNVDGSTLGGASLCRALTEPTYTGRVLGLSRTATYSTTGVTWTATGCGVLPRGDLVTRVVPIRVDPREERPWRRRWPTRDPREVALERRGELVPAALVVLRAYIVAGRPDVGLTPYRFRAWSELVRAAIVWLDRPDPVLGVAEIEGRDADRELLAELMAAWERRIGDRAVTVAEVLTRAKGADADDLRVTVDELCRRRDDERHGELEPASLGRRLGRYLGKVEERIVGGRRFAREHDARDNRTMWRLSTCE